MGIIGWLRHRRRGFRDFAPALTADSSWELRPACSSAEFFRSLPALGLTTGVVAIEGTSDGQLESWLSTNAGKTGLSIRWGTIWPTLDWWYVPLEEQAMETMARIRTSCEPPFIHLYVYDDGGLIIEWYEAPTEPLWIAKRVNERRAQQFAALVNGKLSAADAPE